MEKIITKEKLIELIQGLRAMEIKARDSYKQDIITFTNFKVCNIIETIEKDEERHIEILDEILKVIS
jgi:rubrerythrin